MAICIVKTNKQLGDNFVLTPERYNPLRRMNIDKENTILLSEVIELSTDTLTIKQAKGIRVLQINTSDARGGYLNTSADVTSDINSNKKILKKGDVIISRLRPYLRQVAYVDRDYEDVILGASTEFFVLRARDDEDKSIAYLVPFLLSEAVQTVFANSVEGSQHPRFKEEDVLNLRIPLSIYDSRESISRNVEKAICAYRNYQNIINCEINDVNKAM